MYLFGYFNTQGWIEPREVTHIAAPIKATINIAISANTNNYNTYDAVKNRTDYKNSHIADITFTVNSGVVIGSANANPAFLIPNKFRNGDKVTVKVLGKIYGKGGTRGNGAVITDSVISTYIQTAATSGGKGSNAIENRATTKIDIASRANSRGGGGGGGGGCLVSYIIKSISPISTAGMNGGYGAGETKVSPATRTTGQVIGTPTVYAIILGSRYEYAFSCIAFDYSYSTSPTGRTLGNGKGGNGGNAGVSGAPGLTHSGSTSNLTMRTYCVHWQQSFHYKLPGSGGNAGHSLRNTGTLTT